MKGRRSCFLRILCIAIFSRSALAQLLQSPPPRRTRSTNIHPEARPLYRTRPQFELLVRSRCPRRKPKRFGVSTCTHSPTLAPPDNLTLPPSETYTGITGQFPHTHTRLLQASRTYVPLTMVSTRRGSPHSSEAAADNSGMDSTRVSPSNSRPVSPGNTDRPVRHQLKKTTIKETDQADLDAPTAKNTDTPDITRRVTQKRSHEALEKDAEEDAGTARKREKPERIEAETRTEGDELQVILTLTIRQSSDGKSPSKRPCPVDADEEALPSQNPQHSPKRRSLDVHNENHKQDEKL